MFYQKTIYTTLPFDIILARKVALMYRKTFIGVIVSYLVILTIPLVIMNIIYVNTLRVTESQSNAFNRAMLTQIRDVMDGRLQEIGRFTYQIVTNDRLKKFLNFGKDLSNSQKYEMIQMVDSLTYYKDISPIIDDFYIYYFRSGIILTSSSIYHEELFFQAAYNPNDINVGDWGLDLKNKNYRRSFLSAEIGLPGMSSLDDIEYRQTLFFSGFDEPGAVLVVLLSKSKLVELLRNANIDPSGKIYVIDDTGEIIATTEPNTPEHATFNELSEQEGVLEKSVDGVPHFISYQTSGYIHWKYVVEITEEIFMKQANYVKVLTLRWLAIGAVIGIALTLILALRNYGLIRFLVKILSKNMNTKPESASSEKAYVVESIKTIITQKEQLSKNEKLMIRKTEEMSETINEQRYLIVNSLLCQLVSDSNSNSEFVLSSLNYYGIDISRNSFCVAVVQLISDASVEIGRDSIQSVFHNIQDDFILSNDEEEYLYLALADDGSIVMIINHTNKDNAATEKIYRKMERIISTLCKYANHTYSAGIGSLHDGIQNLQLAYREALKSLDFARLKGIALIFYDDIKESNTMYNYPLQVELNIINSIKTGDYPGATRLIDSVFDYLVKSKLPAEFLRCLVFDLINTIAKVIGEMGMNDEILEKTYSISNLLQFKTIDELHHKINEFCKAACSYANANKKSHNELLKEKILDFIEKHLLDSILSVNYIADEFSITATYLSRFFKEQTSQNLLDYINRSRIEAAKKLLLNKNASVLEIAEHIGYNNDTVLIRMFKKYEGTTPGRYRIDHSINI
jgi:two-component system, response regulator YesN